MSSVAICDICGNRDDMNAGKGPFLDGGAELVLWEDDSQTNDRSEAIRIDFCQTCKNKLIETWPELKAALKARQ